MHDAEQVVARPHDILSCTDYEFRDGYEDRHHVATQALYAAEAGAVHVMSKYKATVENPPNAVQLADLALLSQKPQQGFNIEKLSYAAIC